MLHMSWRLNKNWNIHSSNCVWKKNNCGFKKSNCNRFKCSISIPPKTVRKPLVFRLFQGVYKRNIRLKWFKLVNAIWVIKYLPKGVPITLWRPFLLVTLQPYLKMYPLLMFSMWFCEVFRSFSGEHHGIAASFCCFFINALYLSLVFFFFLGKLYRIST